MLEHDVTLRDVFISYSSVDQALVDRIVRMLESDAGLKVWYAPADIQGGEQFIRRIEDGLRTSQTVVVILSPSARDSYWVEKEWSIRLIQMSKDRTRKLIPVPVFDITDAQIPLLLRDLQYIDFRAVDLNNPITLKEKVHELADSVKGELPPRDVDAIGLPFVAVAMTRKEADDLASEAIFDNPEVAPIERERFGALREALEEHGISDLPSCYGESRNEWQPLTADQTTIRNIIESVVNRLNDDRQQKERLPIIRPQYFSTEFLSPDDEWRGRTWDQLEELGCVLVVDAISMFHPLLRQTFLRSQFLGSSVGAGGRISLVVVSPLSSNILKVNQLLEQELCSHMQRAFDRFAIHLDQFCEFGVGDPRHLRRWLFSILPETAKAVQGQRGLSPEVREAMRSEQGPPTGIGRYAIGRGG